MNCCGGFSNLDEQPTGQTIQTNQWYHLAMTYDAGYNVKVYLNGVEVGSGTAADPGTAIEDISYFGNALTGSNKFIGADGRIDSL